MEPVRARFFSTAFHRNLWIRRRSVRAASVCASACRRSARVTSTAVLMIASLWAKPMKAARSWSSCFSTRMERSFWTTTKLRRPDGRREHEGGIRKRVPLLQRSKLMNRFLHVLILCAFGLPTPVIAQSQPAETVAKPIEVVHVTTALEHLTVLEYGEPVVMVAIGSSAFQVERHEDKVFIKPLKEGVSTDLFVWTASRRFNYELEAPGEVKNMNFAIDRMPPPKPRDTNASQVAEAADLLLTHSLLASEQVDSSSVKRNKHGVTVRIERVLRTKAAVYIHYRVQNRGKLPYRVITPAVYALNVPNSAVSLPALVDRQLNDRMISRLGRTEQDAVEITRVEAEQQDLGKDAETEGVIVLRRDLPSPTILELRFGNDGTQPVKATVVL